MPTHKTNLPPRIGHWQASGHFIQSLGHQIFYRDTGEADQEVLVCIHGYPTSSFDWYAIWDALAFRYRVFASDLLGFGFSDKPQAYEYTIAEQTDILLDVLKQRGIRRFHVLAHDYGTILAQEMLARCNREGLSATITIDSVTFLNGGIFPEMHRPRLAQTLLLTRIGGLTSKLLINRAIFSKTFSDVFGPQTQPSQAEIAEFWSQICYNDGDKVLHLLINYMRERKKFRDRWVHAMQETTIPLSLINGLNDPVSGRHLVERARTELPKATIFELKNIGHYPQVEAPQDVLVSFLRSIDMVNAPKAAL